MDDRDVPGYERVPLDASHTREIVGLIRAIEAHDDPPYRTSYQEVSRALDASAPAAWAGWRSPGGRLVAYGHVRLRQLASGVVTATGGVHPHWRRRGLGVAASHWQTVCGRQLLCTAGAGSGSIVIQIESTNAPFVTHITSLGYRCESTYLEFTRPTDEPFPPRSSEGGIEVVAWEPRLDDEVRRALNRMGAPAGTPHLTYEQWVDTRAHFLPAASRIALNRANDRSPVVGFLVASIYRQDWDALGSRHGCIDMMGIDAEYSQGGVGAALIEDAVTEFRDLRMETVGISVCDRDEGTIALLESLGFRITSRSHEYVLTVDGEGA